jgi:hypothetical protein
MERLYNVSLCRLQGGLCLWLCYNKMRTHTFKTLLPEQHHYLAKRGSFQGCSLLNTEGKVLTFLLCKMNPRKFTNVALRYTENWQEQGTFHDTLRLDSRHHNTSGLVVVLG